MIVRSLIFAFALFWSSFAWGVKLDLSKGAVFTEKNLSAKDTGLERLWVCSSTKEKITVKCLDLGLNPLEGPKAEFYIEIDAHKIVHEYGLRHGISLSECVDMRKQMKKALDSEKDFCILGMRAGDKALPNDRTLVGWVFFEFKSKRVSFCDLCQ